MDVYFEDTKENNIDFVIELEREEENKLYVGQWDRNQHISSLSNNDIKHLIIKMKENHKPAGYIILAGLQNENDSIEFRRIAIKEKNKGIGSQALKLVKEFAFEKQKANRLWLDVRENNKRGRHVYKKEGFTEEGILREVIKSKKGYETLVLMSILKNEYKK